MPVVDALAKASSRHGNAWVNHILEQTHQPLLVAQVRRGEATANQDTAAAIGIDALSHIATVKVHQVLLGPSRRPASVVELARLEGV